MSEKTKNILIGILIVGIISMTVVYAALSQTLNINGSAKVQNRDASWNIHFTHITSGSEVAVTSGTYATVASNTISLDGTSTTATFTMNEFISKYVEGYVNSLKTNSNAPSTITGRLASYEEIYTAAGNTDTDIPSWLQGNYWLGSAYYHVLWYVNGANFDHSYPFNVFNYDSDSDTGGTRPVIIVNTSDLQ